MIHLNCVQPGPRESIAWEWNDIDFPPWRPEASCFVNIEITSAPVFMALPYHFSIAVSFWPEPLFLSAFCRAALLLSSRPTINQPSKSRDLLCKVPLTDYSPTWWMQLDEEPLAGRKYVACMLEIKISRPLKQLKESSGKERGTQETRKGCNSEKWDNSDLVWW